MKISRLESFLIARRDIVTPVKAVRTAVAATAALLVARLFRLPEDFWAAITCIIVTQSTLGAALPVSVLRLAGAAIGSVLGALVAYFLGADFLSFGFSVFAAGILCWVFRIDQSAYRYAGITAAIVMFAGHGAAPSIVAFHRFSEVSIGIAVALVFSAVWPEPPSHKIRM